MDSARTSQRRGPITAGRVAGILDRKNTLQVLQEIAYGELRSSAAPHLNLKPHLLRPSDVTKPLGLPSGISIDIRKTPIVDSQNEGYLSTLDKVLAFTEEKVLAIDGEQARIKTSAKPDGAVFDFRLDEKTEKMGAGTAFLQD